MAANLFVNEPESSVGITPAYYDAHMCSFAVFDQHRYDFHIIVWLHRGSSCPFRVFPIHPSERTKVDRRHIKPGFISTSSPAFDPSCSDITIDLVHPYHWYSANYPYGRSCPLSPALSPTSIYSVRFFPGNMRYAESHISSSPLVCHMCFGSVSSQSSYTIGAQSRPFLQNYYLIAGYAVLPFRWVS